MNYRHSILLVIMILSTAGVKAQKVFTEGVMVYKLTFESPEGKIYSGTYTFICKAGHIRKELKLDNGYQDIVILDCDKGKAYSLQKWEGKKYAIELNIDDIRSKQQSYDGFTMKDEVDNNKKIAGYAVYRGNVHYNNGSHMDVLYTKDWQPLQSILFERFPNAHFIPLSFSNTDDKGITMNFEAEKIEAGPVENIIFRIPPDYKIISNAEYKQLSR